MICATIYTLMSSNQQMSTFKHLITKTCQLPTEFIQSFRQEPFSSGLIPSVFFQSSLEMDWLPVGRGGATEDAFKREGQSVKAQHLCGKDLADSAICHFYDRHSETPSCSYNTSPIMELYIQSSKWCVCRAHGALIVHGNSCLSSVHHVSPQIRAKTENLGLFMQIWTV